MSAKIYASDIEALTDENKLDKAISLLPLWRQERTRRFRFVRDRALSTGAFLLLMHALKNEGVSVGRDMDEFIYNEHKKPYLPPSCNSSLYFNLSHSGRYVMCILSEDENGCDTQQIKDDDIRIADRFFSESEKAYLASCSPDGSGKDIRSKKRAFYEIWALKESCLKAAGYGLSHELSGFDVDLKDMKVTGLDCLADCSLRLYNIDREYIFAACGKDLPEDVILTDVSAILRLSI